MDWNAHIFFILNLLKQFFQICQSFCLCVKACQSKGLGFHYIIYL